MKRIIPNGPVVALTLLSLALAGCGSAAVGSGSPGGPASTASQSPQARAKADAAAILAAFVPPPGATRLGTAPTAGVLRQPVFSEPGPDHVDDASWWRVPGLSPEHVLDWEKAHLPRQFTASGTGTAGVHGVQVTEGWWSLPAVAGVLPQRQITVSVVGDGSGTDLRVDANVEWLRARPAWSMLSAASVTAVVVTAVPGLNDKKPPAPVTVTDPAKVRELVDLVNAQPMASRDVISCPAGNGRGLRLTFLNAAKGTVLATAFAASNGCGGVDLTIGTRQVSLGWGSDVAKQALAISGMNWKLFGYLPM